MIDPSHPIIELLDRDKRYRFDAYVFVFEALNYAQEILKMGTPTPTDDAPIDDEEEDEIEHHVTGQQLCEAIREYAIQQYGYLAKNVLENWGIHKTDDFGEIVFNMIEIGQMRKTPSDRREDFQDVYGFETAFRENFAITPQTD